MTKKIENAIDIFLDALNNGTLAKGDCTMCAVGNLVREGMGLSMEEYNESNLCIQPTTGILINWSLIFSTDEKKQKFKKKTYQKYIDKYPLIKKQLDSVDFSLKELMKIEFAFETHTKIKSYKYKDYTKEEIRADQIKGLEAVVKVMLGFDEAKKDVKEVFTNKAELILI